MKRKVLIICLFISSFLLNAQENRLIYKKSILKSDSKATSILKKSNANKSVDFVNINLEVLSRNEDFILQFGDSEYSIEKEKINVRDIRSFCFTGKNKNQNGSIVMSILEDDIQGTITNGNAVYRIETIGKDDYAIVLMDQSKLIEKCDNTTNEAVNTSQLKHYENDSNNSDDSNISTNSIQFKSEVLEEQYNSCKIRVLVLFTPAAKASVSDIRNTILLAIEETNQSFLRSAINYEIELVYIAETNYVEHDIDIDRVRFSLNGDGYMDEVHSLREKYSADICVLMNNDARYCGASYVGASSSSAFCVVKAYLCATGNYSFGHEIGHLIGCRHDFNVDNSITPFSYGHGYVSPNKLWRTIMATGKECNDCIRIQNWSNPNVSYGGFPTGTEVICNTARVWNEQAPTALAFMQPANSVIVSSSDVANGTYSNIVAKQDISTLGDVDITTGKALCFKAGDNIILKTGFSAFEGSEFYGGIENITDCGSTSLKFAKVQIDDVSAYSNDVAVLTENALFLAISPNPTNDLLNIEFKTYQNSEVSISLVNFLGCELRVIQDRENFESGNFNIQTSVSDLSVGVYFIVLKIGEKVIVKKLIIN
ncbi:MAG: T9SS type A sorting domain-containing protein [Bacteroidales bacterium]|nr:T9SS type A sorting domain-containing protein [Bacteroidales bacterium]